MKNFKYFLVIVLSAGLANNIIAQTKPNKNAAKLVAVRAMVQNQDFNFVAQYANPQGGGHRFLNSEYDFRVKKDSVIAYLPYFGQGYFDVPYNPTDGGIKFTSTDFTYKITEKKKGGWDVIIEPKDAKYYQRVNLYVGTSGYGTLYFTITNRSFINFDGYITAADKK